MKKIHALLVTLLFGFASGAGLFALALLPSPEVLQSERRKPAAPPAFSDLRDGSWMRNFENYAADKFPLRDSFRRLRAFTALYLLRQTDKDGLYLDQGHAGKFEPLNETAALRCAEMIAKLAANYPDQQVYYAIIPDKSIYARRDFPGLDPARLREVAAPILDELTEIDLVPALSLGSYYRTDLHWDQAKLRPVVEALGDRMGFTPRWDFTTQGLGAFHGVYAGQLALPLKPDEMTILTDGVTDGAAARYFDAKSGEFVSGPVYHSGKVTGRDPYDVFLDGAQALVILENPNAETDRELYVFRDSFGSSIAPLLLPNYRRVTLIDLRYINARILPQYVTFSPGADVLFLCGWQIFNANTWMT
ncbi:MAG: hypothetical protein FWF05_08010 [Oscillospiraceae bacterium]|nr:hypothetical protein [Oscillospiraceae bacterium]